MLKEVHSMKRIVCEMCEGTEFVKENGFFVCQMCGTKYSLDEAKKMMIEGMVDVSGSTVNVSNLGNIDNYMKMAESADEAGNEKEAENYCNKILELDNQNYTAWLLKGKVAGWQSTIANPRLNETMKCFVNAIEYSPEEQKKEIINKTVSEADSICLALIQKCCDIFMENPSTDNASNITDAVKMMENCVGIFNEKCGKENVKMSITSGAVNIRVASTKGWTQALTQYCKDQHPSAYEWEKFVERGEAVILLNKLQILMIQDGSMSDYDKVTCYKEMINVQATLLKSGGWEYENSCWLKKYHFSLNESQKRRNLISNWHMEWSKIDPKHTIELANAREKMKRERMALIGVILMIILGIMWFFVSNTQKQNTNYDLGSYKSDSTISETYDETSNKPKIFKRTILKNDVTLHDDKDETDEESSSDENTYEDKTDNYWDNYQEENSIDLGYGVYIIADSDTRRITNEDLKRLSKEECRLARNEIYARHGRRFHDSQLQEYFDAQSWYEGTRDADTFSERELSQIEKDNVKKISQYEKKFK